jgi:hypothetical protein
VLSLCKRVNLSHLPANNCLNEIWANQSMKRKCWLFFMLLIVGVLIYWGNASKLRQIIKALIIFWNNTFPPQRKKNGLLSSLDMIMRSFAINEKTMWLQMHFPKNMKMKGPFFIFLHCTRLATSRSPRMATRSQKFSFDTKIAVHCSSFPRVLLAP